MEYLAPSGRKKTRIFFEDPVTRTCRAHLYCLYQRTGWPQKAFKPPQARVGPSEVITKPLRAILCVFLSG